MFWLVFLFIWSAQATPDDIEVWFLSMPSTGHLEKYLAPKLTGVKVAQACEAIGDYCFDPKIGLYEKVGPPPADPTYVIDDGLPQLPTATSVDRSLVNCDAKYAFDIFCGKAQPMAKSSEAATLEVWIDTSSSLRTIDPIDSSGQCQRSALVEKLLAICNKKKPIIKGFDTQIRDITTPTAACVSQGLNDEKKMIQWMEDSSAKKLLLITDVYEYQADLAHYFEAKRSKIRGDRGVFPARQMLDYVNELAKVCE